LNLSTLPPADCSKDKFDSFLKLVEKGEEVISSKLEDRIKNAKLLAFCHDGEQLVGVGAIKNPAKTYKEKTFKKAGHQGEEGKFKYELGYIFVEKI